MKLNDLLTVLYPVINIIIGLVVAWIGGVIVKLAPGIFNLIESKIGIANYNKMKTIGIDVFNKIEEDGRLGKLVNSKIVEFETLIKTKVPGITDSEIELIRQSIAGEFNKDKPLIVDELKTQLQETVIATPIIKYYAADGITELQPVEHSILNTPSIT